MGIINELGNKVGKFWNQISGTTATQEFNAAEAEKQRNWEEHMSSTAHQREVTDMQAAGINPALTALGGNGATTPTGASASSGQNGAGALAGIGMIINSAASLANTTNNIITKSKIYNNADKIFNAAIKIASMK